MTTALAEPTARTWVSDYLYGSLRHWKAPVDSFAPEQRYRGSQQIHCVSRWQPSSTACWATHRAPAVEPCSPPRRPRRLSSTVSGRDTAAVAETLPASKTSSER